VAFNADRLEFWFLNIDQLYGAVNVAAAGSWQKPSDMLTYRKQDWLSSAGAEIRLKAKSFGFPWRWTCATTTGFNRPAPLGGDHITFTLGFDFWTIGNSSTSRITTPACQALEILQIEGPRSKLRGSFHPCGKEIFVFAR